MRVIRKQAKELAAKPKATENPEERTSSIEEESENKVSKAETKEAPSHVSGVEEAGDKP